MSKKIKNKSWQRQQEVRIVHLILTTKWLKKKEEEMGKQINDGT